MIRYAWRRKSSLYRIGCRGILTPSHSSGSAVRVGSHVKETAKMGDESFALIEKKIADLVQVVATLRKEKDILAGELSAKEGEVRELNRKLADLSRERGEVKERVEKILSRLDTIEL